MTAKAVVAYIPVSYVDKDGKQVFVDLRDLRINDGKLEVIAAPSQPYTPEGVKYLKSLVDAKLLEAATVPPVGSAVLFEAADAGTASNATHVEIAASTADPAKFTVTVRRTDRYPGVTLAALERALGSEAAPSKRPGLVRLVGAVGNVLPMAQDQKLAIVAAAKRASIKLDAAAAGDGKSFALEAKGEGKAGEKTTVKIKDVDPAKQTFTLEATWELEVADIPFTDPEKELAEAVYLIAVKLPPGTTKYEKPSLGTYYLGGGVDAAHATAVARAAST